MKVVALWISSKQNKEFDMLMTGSQELLFWYERTIISLQFFINLIRRKYFRIQVNLTKVRTRGVRQSVAESVPDKDSVRTRNAALEAVSALEQNCSAPLLKVECYVLDRFLKRSKSSLNTFIGAEIATLKNAQV